MKLLNSIVTWAFKRRISQVEEFVQYPHLTQQTVFKSLLKSAKKTYFGIEHGFQSIQSFKDYQDQVPIRSYEEIFPYIDRIIHGEQNVLWNTDITWFAKSSGTTSGKSKYIPVSKETLDGCHFKGGKDVMALYTNNNPDSQVFSGKSLIMGGSHTINEHNKNSKLGDVSAVMMQNMPLLGHVIQTPDLKTALLDEWEEKLEKITAKTIHQNVTNISGVPTWSMILLERILAETGKSTIAEVWENLEVYIHGGVNFQPYKQQFERLIGLPNMKYYQMYNASEGFFAMQDQNNVDDMLLMLDYGIFYEFIPIDSLGEEQPTTLALEDVELGKTYALIISTNSGLWRYKIGDTVTFTSVNPYRIKVAGRTKSYINAFGEELMVENADVAIQKACEETNAILKDYTAAPIYLNEGKQGAHEWLIEFIQEPSNKELFVKVLDDTLQSINSDYEAKRHKSIALEKPHIHIVPKGTFTKWLRFKGKMGGQNKVPRLMNNRSILEEILRLIEN